MNNAVVGWREAMPMHTLNVHWYSPNGLLPIRLDLDSSGCGEEGGRRGASARACFRSVPIYVGVFHTSRIAGFFLRILRVLTHCHHGGHFDVDVFRYHGACISVLHHLHVVMGEMRSEWMGGDGRRRWWLGNLRRSCFAARTMVRTIKLLLYRFS